MSAFLELFFFFYRNKTIDRFKLSFQKEEQSIKKNRTTIKLPESIFNYGKDKSQISIKLFKDSKNFKEYNFNVYYGENKGYIQIDVFCSKSFEIIFKSIKGLKIYGVTKDIEFTELDSIENKDKKRLLLINCLSELNINEEYYNLADIVRNNCEIINSSYQLSEIELSSEKFIVKPFMPKEDCELDFLVKNKQQYQTFAEELDKLFVYNNEEYLSNISVFQNKYEKLTKYKFIHFHQTNEYLINLFKSKKDLDIDVFFNFFKCVYFFDNIKDFTENRIVNQCFFEKINDILENIKNHDSIPIHEKIRALHALFFTKDNLNKAKELASLNLKYYAFSEKVKKSILDRVAKFFE